MSGHSVPGRFLTGMQEEKAGDRLGLDAAKAPGCQSRARKGEAKLALYRCRRLHIFDDRSGEFRRT